MFNQYKLRRTTIALLGLFSAMNFSSCGFAYEKRITGKYYIIGVDTKTDLSLSYKLSSDNYVGKAPGQLLKYGFNDTFLVAKTKEYNKTLPSYYIIDMTSDAELAREETFRIGPLTEGDYNQTWRQRLGIRLQDVR
jgi:hypothetical protein